jgi:hypothetical protein
MKEFSVGVTSLNADHPAETPVASSKSSTNASAGVFVRTLVPAPAQTPVCAGYPLDAEPEPEPVVVAAPEVPDETDVPDDVLAPETDVLPEPAVA